MTFFALLTKEMRLRMRRERTIWVVVLYVMLMGLLSWFFIRNYNATYSYITNGTNDTGNYLYMLMTTIQLFLIVCITPAFTTTTINGEKEQQTYDLLLCSKISSFSLVAAKLTAALLNALLLMAAAIPLFSRVFFFGGVPIERMLNAIVIFIATTLLIGTFGLYCSTLMRRPSLSTAITYVAGLLWMILPIVITFLLLSASGLSLQNILQTLFQGNQNNSISTISNVPPVTLPLPSGLFIWNPVMALASTYSSPALNNSIIPATQFHNTHVDPWVAFTYLCLLASAIFFLLSMWASKPRSFYRQPREHAHNANPPELPETA